VRVALIDALIADTPLQDVLRPRPRHRELDARRRGQAVIVLDRVGPTRVRTGVPSRQEVALEVAERLRHHLAPRVPGLHAQLEPAKQVTGRERVTDPHRRQLQLHPVDRAAPRPDRDRGAQEHRVTRGDKAVIPATPLTRHVTPRAGHLRELAARVLRRSALHLAPRRVANRHRKIELMTARARPRTVEVTATAQRVRGRLM